MQTVTVKDCQEQNTDAIQIVDNSRKRIYSTQDGMDIESSDWVLILPRMSI